MKDISDLRDLFQHSYPEFHSFADPGKQFSEDEDDYKRAAVVFLHELFDEWIQVQPDALDPIDFTERFKRLLRDQLPGLDYSQNFLNWRDLDFIWKSLLDTPEVTKAFMRRLHPMLVSAAQGRDAVRAPLASLLDWLAEKGCTASISKALPSVLLWFCQPSQFVFVKPAVFDRFLRRIGEPPLGSGKPLTVDEYFRVLSVMDKVGEQIAALLPRDMIDLQGFYWSVQWVPDHPEPAPPEGREGGGVVTSPGSPHRPKDLPLNLILYGPPGTGNLPATPALRQGDPGKQRTGRRARTGEDRFRYLSPGLCLRRFRRRDQARGRGARRSFAAKLQGRRRAVQADGQARLR